MPFSKINDIKLYYEDNRAEDQVPLIFLHGWMGCINHWRSQIKYFDDKRRIIALDFKGHGRSDKPIDNYSVQQLSQELYLFMKKQKIVKAIFSGHSLGGMVGLRFVLDHQKMVEKLILVDTLARSDYSFWRRLIIKVIGKTLKIIPYKLFVKIYASRTRRKYYTKNENEKFQKKLLETPKQVFNSLLQIKSVKFDVISELGGIQVPTLIIYGSEDKNGIQVHNQAQCMKEHIPKAEVAVIKGAKHFPMIEKPNIVSRSIEKFIIYA